VKRPTVLLADDHPLILDALRSLLDPVCDVVGAERDGRALMKVASQLKPDVIVLDISLPLLNGIDAARQIKKELPNTKVLFLTMHSNPKYLTEALNAGASGYVLKTSAAEELPGAIEDALRSRIHVTPGFGKDIVEQFERRLPSSPRSQSVLTARQREILQLVAEGRSAKEIASILNISLQTVAFHKYQIMNKLGKRTTAELTKYAIQEGLVE